MMTYQDIEVLTETSQRLFAESVEEFRAAHEKWKKSLDAPTFAEQVRGFNVALMEEDEALAKQRLAIEMRLTAMDERAKCLARFKETVT